MYAQRFAVFSTLIWMAASPFAWFFCFIDALMGQPIYYIGVVLVPVSVYFAYRIYYRNSAEIEVRKPKLPSANPMVDDYKRLYRELNTKKNLIPTLTLILLIATYSIIVFIRFGANPTLVQLFNAGGGFGGDTAHGQIWRLLSPIFIHANFDHLIANMVALFIVGRYVTYVLPRPAFFFLFFVSGMFGAALSAVAHPLVVSVGASGAIFGFYGAMLAAVLFSKQNKLVQNIPKWAIYYLVYDAFRCLYLGATDPHIDNWAHIGGFISGCAIAALIFRAQTSQRPLRLVYGPVALCLVALVAFVLPSAVARPRLQPRNLMTVVDIVGLLKPIAALEGSLHSHKVSLNEKKITPNAFFNWIATDFTPAWQSEAKIATAQLAKEHDEALAWSISTMNAYLADCTDLYTYEASVPNLLQRSPSSGKGVVAELAGKVKGCAEAANNFNIALQSDLGVNRH